jgi:hypothetical protein
MDCPSSLWRVQLQVPGSVSSPTSLSLNNGPLISSHPSLSTGFYYSNYGVSHCTFWLEQLGAFVSALWPGWHHPPFPHMQGSSLTPFSPCTSWSGSQVRDTHRNRVMSCSPHVWTGQDPGDSRRKCTGQLRNYIEAQIIMRSLEQLTNPSPDSMAILSLMSSIVEITSGLGPQPMLLSTSFPPHALLWSNPIYTRHV